MGGEMRIRITMRNFKFLSVAAAFLFAFTTWAAAQAPTVADIAREYRKTKGPTQRVLTNESLAFKASSGESSAPSATTGMDASASKSEAKPGEKPTDDSAEGKQKLAEEWKAKIEAQKTEMARLQRELDVSQRENKLRAASFYADAGTRLRDSQKYAEEDKKYQAEAAEKQKAIAAVQQAVDKLRDEARRAGVPPGQIP